MTLKTNQNGFYFLPRL